MAKKPSKPSPQENGAGTPPPSGGMKAVLPGVQTKESRAQRGFREIYKKEEEPAPPEEPGLTPALGKSEAERVAGEEEAEQPKNPGAHRLNPDKNAKLQALEDLREETEASTEEWRDGMERAVTDEEPEDVRQGKFRRLVLAGILMIALGGYFVFRYGVKTAEADNAPARNPALVAFDAEQELVARCLAVLQDYLKAETVSERFAFTRDSEERMRDMERFFRDRPEEAELEVLGETLASQRFSRGGKEFLGLVYEFDDVSRRGVVFELTQEGPRLDWRSFVGYSDMTIKEFLEVQPLEPMLMRVVLTEDDYYNFGYGDPEKWVCVKVENASRDLSFWAYCPRNSPAHLALVAGEKELAAKRIGIFEAVVQVRFEEGGRGRKQALLEEFVAAGHLVP